MDGRGHLSGWVRVLRWMGWNTCVDGRKHFSRCEGALEWIGERT